MQKLSKDQLLKCIKNVADNGQKRISIKKEDYISVYPKTPDITVTGDKTYITNLKVLLAQNLYIGSKMIKLNDKLSTILKIPEPPIGWYVSEKYDGIRAIWDGEKFISRGQKVFTYVPQYFIDLMPPGIALDGEMWISRNNFKEVSRISTLKIGRSRTQKEIDKIWRGTNENNSVKYMVYDLPNSSEPFESRMKYLKQVVDDRTLVWNHILENLDDCPIKFTKQTKIESMAQLVSTYKELTSKGAEGVMLRAPNSPYETKRSKYLLKYKIKEDAEAIVRGYTMGTGKYKGLLGSLDCELILDQKPCGVMFNIGTGFTDKDRTEYNNSKSSLYIPIGSIVSFSYMELSEDSVPRHPVYRGIRDDFTIKQNTELESKDEIQKDYRQMIIDTFSILIKNEEIKKESNWQFKRKAYKQVIDILSNNTEKIDSIKKALDILRKGGAKLDGEEAYFIKHGEYKSKTLQKISEIIKTGFLTKAIEIQEGPEGQKVKSITELTKIPEIGPSKAEKLYKDGITTIAELTVAFTKDSKILNSKQQIGLKYYSDLEKRIPRSEMDSWNEFFKVILNFTIKRMKIKPENVKMQLVGSYRRKAKDSGDIDILLTSKDSEQGKNLMKNFIKELLRSDNLDNSLVFSSGTTKFMGLGKIDNYYRHIDIFYYPEKEYPFALLFSTGSGQFNIEMRADAIKKGYSLSEKALV
jgi:DNA polymerase/3'-5' exonuclease PolX